MRDSETVITELLGFIKAKGSSLKQQIRSQKTTEVSRVKEQQKKLKQEIAELKRKDAELKQLLNIEDHTELILSHSLQSELSGPAASPVIRTSQNRYFEDVQTAVSEARDRLKETTGEEWSKISATLRSVDVLLQRAEPSSRDELLKYSHPLTLDPNTAHANLHLSNQGRTVTDSLSGIFSNNSGRYSSCHQVLSKDSVTKPLYWEVEWTGSGIIVAVTYKNRDRLDQGGFGATADSWALNCYGGGYEFRHNNVVTPVFSPGSSSTVGVFVDPRAGVLSFYSVSETATLLYRVQTAFTRPLYRVVLIFCPFPRLPLCAQR
uniref:B30.2/SPRY domain-containing protein n=1 Tax=Stegastes partitus TaxID=144197 RepID=A0A3B5BDY5_9TELE